MAHGRAAHGLLWRMDSLVLVHVLSSRGAWTVSLRSMYSLVAAHGHSLRRMDSLVAAHGLSWCMDSLVVVHGLSSWGAWTR